jgi:hypothetical protein
MKEKRENKRETKRKSRRWSLFLNLYAITRAKKKEKNITRASILQKAERNRNREDKTQ